MSHPIFHTTSAVKFVGASRQSLAVHVWLDQTKELFADARHRALRHNAFAANDLAFLPFAHLGPSEVITAAAFHIMEDCYGKMPSPHDYADEIRLLPWMLSKSKKQDILKACARRCGGKPQDYERLYRWFKLAPRQNPRLAYLRLHAQGIFEAERSFGLSITTADGPAPTRYAAETIVKRLCSMPGGLIPSADDWLKVMTNRMWMNRPLPLEKFFRGCSQEAAALIVKNELAKANRGRQPIFLDGNIFANGSQKLGG